MEAQLDLFQSNHKFRSSAVLYRLVCEFPLCASVLNSRCLSGLDWFNVMPL